MLSQSVESRYNEVSESEFQITGKGYSCHTLRVSEALFIKNKKLSLSEEDKSNILQILNCGMQIFSRFSLNNN